MAWDPDIYLLYREYRNRPVQDLLAGVSIEAPQRIYDLGCGPGNSTDFLASRFMGAKLTGVDSSPQMIEKAKQAGPDLADWLLADLSAWSPSDTPDLLFSNATFQWLPKPGEVLPRLFSLLPSGGVFAFQVPANLDQPSHTLMNKALEHCGFSDETIAKALAGTPRYTLPADIYYDLFAAEASRIDIWDTQYLHVLYGDDPVAEWTAGTALRPVLSALGEDQGGDFLTAYKEMLRAAYPVRYDGATLFPFLRRFVVATHH